MSEREAEHLARLEAMLTGLQRDAAESQRELAAGQEQRAEAARDGSMGRDWQDVQRRIDAGKTTLSEVFTGVDDSPAAQRLLGLSRDNITRMADAMPLELQEEIAEVDTEYLRIGRGGIPPRPTDAGRPR